MIPAPSALDSELFNEMTKGRSKGFSIRRSPRKDIHIMCSEQVCDIVFLCLIN
jgi:hypothetical protein